MLHAERSTTNRDVQGVNTAIDEELARKRQRLAELMSRLGTPSGLQPGLAEGSSKSPDSNLPGARSVPGSRGQGQGGTTVIDPLAMAQNYFQAGDYEEALRAYRLVPSGGLRPDERVSIQYMIATCLRKLGKIDEAMPLYREVSGFKGDNYVGFVAECAGWQVRNLSELHALRTQLAQLQQRRKALETVP